jgi:hypothetical protein
MTVRVQISAGMRTVARGLTPAWRATLTASAMPLTPYSSCSGLPCTG